MIRGLSPATGLTWLTRQVAATVLPAGTRKITFTSGSTGEPKGVCLGVPEQLAVATSVAAVARNLGATRHYSALPLATLLENVAGVYASWMAGVTCLLGSRTPTAIADGTLVADTFAADFSAQVPSTAILVPELLRMLVGQAESGWRMPSSTRLVAVGGAKVANELIERAAAVGLPAYQGYGLSECSSVTCLNTPDASRRGSVGRALPHARVRRSPEGELRVSGTVMAGYLGQQHAGADSEFATGDLGEIDPDGYVYVAGRIKNLIIDAYGRNLSPEWIESEIGQEPGIGKVVAFGDACSRIVGLVVPAAANLPDSAIEAAVARGNARLPPYARIARYAVLRDRGATSGEFFTANGRPRRDRIAAACAGTLEKLHGEPRESFVS